MDTLFASAFEWLKTAGLVGAMAVFIYGLHKEWWVMGSQYRRVVAENDFNKSMAERATALGETITDTTRSVVRNAGAGK